MEPGTPAYETTSWVRTGGPPGGLGYDIRMSPDNLDVMYVTDDGAGAFRSEDGGLSWTPMDGDIDIEAGRTGDSLSVFSLTVDPNNSDSIWVGISGSSMVYHSTDGGDHWTGIRACTQEFAATIRGIAIEPGNSDIVYVAAEVPSFEWNTTGVQAVSGLDMTQGVVYRSDNGGESWKRIWSGDNLARYILIHPTTPNLIYVSTGIFDRNAANATEEDPGGVGILRSTDRGETWDILDEDNGFDHFDLYIGALRMHPTNPEILLAGAGNDRFGWVDDEEQGGAYLTTDGGDTWTQTLILGNTSAVEICRGEPDIMYTASMGGVHRSEDGGRTWEERAGNLWGPPNIAAGFPIDMLCDPRDSNRVFINNYIGGNFLSEDGGTTWVLAADGYTGARANDIALSSDGKIYAIGRSGLFVSEVSEDDWDGLGYGLAHNVEGQGVAVDPHDANHIYQSLSDTGPLPLESFDGGLTWRRAPMEELHPLFEPSIIADIIFSPQDSQTIFAIPTQDPFCLRGLETAACADAGGPGLVVSRDGGASWSVLSSLSTGQVVSLVISAEVGGPLYASVYGRGVLRSDDNGGTWDLVNADPMGPNRPVFEDPDRPDPGTWVTLSLDPNNSERLYAGFGAGGTATSSDGGLTWQYSAVGMQAEAPIVSIVPDGSHDGVVYAASPNFGVFVSQNGGETWTIHNDGLTQRAAINLALTPDGSVLYVGTDGGGVFRLGSTN